MEIKHKLNDYGVRVFINGCAKRGEGSRFRAKAHTHCPKSTHHGWICFMSNKWIDCEPVWKHELAHYLTGLGHVDKWRDKLLELGGTLDPVYDQKGYMILKSYHKKKRRII